MASSAAVALAAQAVAERERKNLELMEKKERGRQQHTAAGAAEGSEAPESLMIPMSQSAYGLHLYRVLQWKLQVYAWLSTQAYGIWSGPVTVYAAHTAHGWWHLPGTGKKAGSRCSESQAPESGKPEAGQKAGPVRSGKPESRKTCMQGATCMQAQHLYSPTRFSLISLSAAISPVLDD